MVKDQIKKTVKKVVKKKVCKKVAKKKAVAKPSKKAIVRVVRSVPPPPAAPTHEQIARLAYELWERRGRPFGSSDEDWVRAEEELRRRAAQAAD